MVEEVTNDEPETLIEKALAAYWGDAKRAKFYGSTEGMRAAFAVFKKAALIEHECTWECWVDRYGQDHHANPADSEQEARTTSGIDWSRYIENPVTGEVSPAPEFVVPADDGRTVLAVARNIVNQIADLYFERIPSPDWVKVRQETNDELDAFVARLIAGVHPRPIQAEPQEVDADPDTAFELGRVAGYDEAMREVRGADIESLRARIGHPDTGAES